MSRLISVLLITCVFAINDSHGMDCSGLYTSRSTNIVEKIINSCPPLLGSSDDAYCCIDPFRENVYCCNAAEYFANFGILGLILIAIFVIASVIVSCICCICCSCCPWYKRRHRGTVYSRRTVA